MIIEIFKTALSELDIELLVGDSGLVNLDVDQNITEFCYLEPSYSVSDVGFLNHFRYSVLIGVGVYAQFQKAPIDRDSSHGRLLQMLEQIRNKLEDSRDVLGAVTFTNKNLSLNQFDGVFDIMTAQSLITVKNTLSIC